MSSTRVAITIGNFDGVHAGHRALVRRARELVGPEGRVVAVTFHPHPITRLRPDTRVELLTTIEQRTELLRAAGADEVDRLEPTPELLGRSPGEFLAWISERHGRGWIVEGPDFRFGKGRAGDLATLRDLAPRHGLEPSVVEPVSVALRDQSIVRASSTTARWLIANGRVRDAALVLGRPYTIAGRVVRGDRLGRTIGFPTANIATGNRPPGDGVYAGIARLADGRRFAAAVNSGTRPTVEGAAHRLEAHLLNASPGEAFAPIAGLDEYGWPIELELIAWVRDQVRFAGVDMLREQLTRDIERVADLMGDHLDIDAMETGAA
ncbi:MAG: riboflavin kinase [Planctomycetota bacterium]